MLYESRGWFCRPDETLAPRIALLLQPGIRGFPIYAPLWPTIRLRGPVHGWRHFSQKGGGGFLELRVHGISNKGDRWTLLSIKQSRRLAIDLLVAAERAEESRSTRGKKQT